jgi:hypothetical protein
MRIVKSSWRAHALSGACNPFETPKPSLVFGLAGGRLRDGNACWLALTAICSPFLLVLPLVIKRNNPVKEAIPSLKPL